MGNFELDLRSYLFYKFVLEVSTILLYHMYGRWFILFFILSSPRVNIGRSTNTEYYFVLVILYVTLNNTVFENKSRLTPHPKKKKKKLCGTRTHGSKLTRCHSNKNIPVYIFRTSGVSSTNFGSVLIFWSCLLVLVLCYVGKKIIGRGPILLYIKKSVSPLQWLVLVFLPQVGNFEVI